MESKLLKSTNTILDNEALSRGVSALKGRVESMSKTYCGKRDEGCLRKAAPPHQGQIALQARVGRHPRVAVPKS